MKHGGELSHFPGLGTIGRIEYLYLELIVIPHVLVYLIFSPGWDLWHVLSWYHSWIWEHWKIILGLSGADTIHWALDHLDLWMTGLENKIGLPH